MTELGIDFYTTALCSAYPQVFDYLRANVHDYHLAEDLTQDTYEKALKKRESFDESKGNLIGWLKTIAHNTYLDYFRNVNRHPTEELVETEIQYGSSFNIDNLLDVKEALRILDKNERKMFDPFICGVTTGEIARELKKPLGTVKSSVYRSKVKVRQALQPPQITTVSIT